MNALEGGRPVAGESGVFFALAPYIAAGACALAVTFILMPRLIRSFAARGMVGKDMNKADQREVPEMGGVGVVAGFFVGIIVLMGFDAFTSQNIIPNMPLLLAALIAALGAAFVGAIDDVFELRQRVKAVLPILFGFPLGFMVTDQAVHLPGGVIVGLGALMIPLIAFMVSAGANAANMLEGFNGLGAGLGIITAAALTILTVTGVVWAPLALLVPYLGATTAFLWFNRFPARVFPGDTFTLFSGATLVSAAVLLNYEEVAALFFIPMIAEFALKARFRFNPETYGTPTDTGKLAYGGRIGSLTHMLMRAGLNTEKKVVFSLWALEGFIAGAAITVILT